MINTYSSINSSIVSIYSKPDSKSELESEGLYGDNFEIIKKSKGWNYIKNQMDGSQGWIKEKCFPKIYGTHKVNTVITNIKKDAKIKSMDLDFLLFNSKVNVVNTDENWAKIKINKDNENSIFGYIPLYHLDEINAKYTSKSIFATKFLNSPYKWGGRSFLGIDCSGLIQIVLNFTNCNFFPRNSSEQEAFVSNRKLIRNQLQTDDLVFWKGHVGIMKNKNELIHSSSYRMCVMTEKLDDVIDRIYKSYNLEPSFYRYK